jgi:subtilisin family serine protease
MKLVRWIALAAMLLMTSVALAGTISPRLQAEMDRTAPNTPISVVITLADQAPLAQIDAQLKATNATRQERHARVVTALQEAAARSQGPLKSMLDEEMRAGTVNGYTCYWISNLIVVQGKQSAIRMIAARTDVDYVEPTPIPQLIEPVNFVPPPQNTDEVSNENNRAIGIAPGIVAIRARNVWQQLGYRGTGRLIGGMDTGVMGTHPALQTRWRGYQGAQPWQECWLDVLGTGTQVPTDTGGHGTHTMGTMTGLAPNDTIGVAPGAKWISCNAINQGVGAGFDSDVVTGFQWFADPDGNPNTIDDVPDVVQNSWGVYEGLGYPANCDNRWWTVLDGCAAAGVCLTWSAGNEGPSAQTLRSPADRATTLYEAFSVGAVDAQNPNNWPYPIASFSSRGPSGCTGVPPANLIKPEVAAPGVGVYSSYNNGGYTNMDGTSMAGPHVAGIVALMREANPNLDVDAIRQILMQTARDEGTTGEDNTYGWGFVDAYAACVAATTGFGQIDGYVRNGSWLNLPLAGATVRVISQGSQFTSDVNGFYHGAIAPGTYQVEASLAGFQPVTLQAVIVQNQTTHLSFSLTDIGGPAITNVTDPKTTNDTVGPYVINATITDPSTVNSAKLYYRVNTGGFTAIDMTLSGGVYTGSLPGTIAGNHIDFYVWAKDGANNVSTSPAMAPTNFYTLYITSQVYAYDCETTPTDWLMGIPGDGATSGIWICDDPIGTTYGSPAVQVQPEDDHTVAPGVKCFVTGNGTVGGAVGDQDVDGGCTTLESPTYALGSAQMAFFSYWRWYALNGNSTDDTWLVQVSGDGGATWQTWESVTGNHNSWEKITKSVGDVFNPLPATVKFRFVACDQGTAGLVEAAIDDLTMDTFTQNAVDVAGTILATRTELAQNQPNPFNPKTTIRFTLSNPAQTRIEIYDAAGRMIRTLINESRNAGVHQVTWDGMDDAGKLVGSGVYFYRLKAGAFEQSRRMTILK